MHERLPVPVYVCPTGASDTENSIIDTAKCVGCGTCAAACPSGAISMVPVNYPPQQPKAETVLTPAYALANAKARQEKAAGQLAAAAGPDGLYRLLTAMTRSIRLVNEDLTTAPFPHCAARGRFCAQQQCGGRLSPAPAEGPYLS